MKGELFLAWRYLKPQKSTISLLTYVSLLGPILGVGILVVVISVMNGMPKELEKKLIAYNAHITIANKGAIKGVQSITSYLESNFDAFSSPVTTCPVLLQKENGDSEFLFAKGVLPTKDSKVSQLKNMLLNNQGQESYSLKANEIIISQSLADNMNLKVGDTVLLHSAEKYKNMMLSQDVEDISQKTSVEYIIANLYSSGLPEVDNNFIVSHLFATNSLMDFGSDQCQTIEMAIPDYNQAEEVADKMISDKYFNKYRVIPWQRQHGIKHLHKAIDRQKALMMFVLLFIVIGAAIGVAACLFSMVIQKTREIGILKATGVSPASIIFVFICQGGILGFLGTLFGLAGGFLTLTYRNEVARLFGFWDATLYRLNEVPAYYDFLDISIIIASAIFICTLGSFIPAFIAASVNPVKALQSQG